jgi:hypothetical protein
MTHLKIPLSKFSLGISTVVTSQMNFLYRHTTPVTNLPTEAPRIHLQVDSRCYGNKQLPRHAREQEPSGQSFALYTGGKNEWFMG